MLQLIYQLLPGIQTSLILTVVSLFFAFLLAIGFTYILTLRISIAELLVKIFIVCFTGTPLLIQFFLIYYGPSQFDWIQQTPWLWNTLSQPYFCAILALTLNSAAYSTLLFDGAVKSIPKGQWEACAALGMTKVQSCALLIKYALKRSLPAYSNEIILIFKSTSLASTITLMDIMGYSSRIFGLSYDINAYLAAGIVYLIINGVLTLMLRWLERYWLAFE